MVIRLRRIHFMLIFFVCACISLVVAAAEKPFETVAASAEVRLPVIMYHHITEKPGLAGKYTVLKSELESDFDYLKKEGYTSVLIEDLIRFVEGKGTLPEKPVLITFDDGFESFYAIAYPLLREKEMKAVLAVIGSAADRYSKIDDHNLKYSNLNWQEIEELSASGLVEIQNHTYDMHGNGNSGRKGLRRKSSESAESYRKALQEDLCKLQDLITQHTGKTPTAIVYPFGAFSPETKTIIRDIGFQASLICEERMNKLRQGDPSCLYGLGRYNRPSGISSEKFFAKVLSAK